MGAIDKGYISVLKSLKTKIRKARLKAAIAVNRELLELYWEIGNDNCVNFLKPCKRAPEAGGQISEISPSNGLKPPATGFYGST